MQGYTSVSSKGYYDLESEEVLYPGLSPAENHLRWGFIRKVYGILSFQLLLTTLVSFVTVFCTPINDLLGETPAFFSSSSSSPFFLASVMGRGRASASRASQVHRLLASFDEEVFNDY